MIDPNVLLRLRREINNRRMVIAPGRLPQQDNPHPMIAVDINDLAALLDACERPIAVLTFNNGLSDDDYARLRKLWVDLQDGATSVTIRT